jgi:hypothetical protein
MPCLPPVDPSDPCWIETEGEDEDEELVGAGAGAGAGAVGCDVDGGGVDDAVGVTDATAGVAEEAGAEWWTTGFLAAA